MSIALALSIPATVLSREQIISNSFGVVLFTLLIQGLTTKLLLKKLNLLDDQSLRQHYLELVARREALQQVLDHLIQTEKPAIAPASHQKHIEFVTQQLQQFQHDIECMQTQHLQLQAFNLQQHQDKLLTIEAEAYTKFVQAGFLKNPLPLIMQKAFDGE